MACSVTGVGENIMRAGLARLVCQDVSSDEQNMDGICRTILKSHIVDAELPVRFADWSAQSMQASSIPILIILGDSL